MTVESYEDQLLRVRLMAGGESDTWDLSPNDIRAISAVLEHLAVAEARVAVLQQAVDTWEHIQDQSGGGKHGPKF